MGNIVGSLLVKLSAMTADFDKGMDHSANKVKQFGADVSKYTIGNIAGNLATMGIQRIGDLAMDAVQYVMDMAREMDDMSDAAEKLGISLHSYLVFENVARQSATSIDTIGAAINRMKRNIAEGSVGKTIGLDNASLFAMAPEEAFSKIGKAVARIQNPMERARVEIELFGKSGAELDLVIQRLASDYDTWANAVASESAAKGLADAGQAIEDFTVAAKKLSIEIAGTVLIEARNNMDRFMDWLTDSQPGFTQAFREMNRTAERANAAIVSSTSKAIESLGKLRGQYAKLIDPRGAAFEDLKDLTAGMDPKDAAVFESEFQRIQDAMENFNAAKEESIRWENHIEEVNRFGEQLRKATLTPLEEFQDKLQEIAQWRKEAEEIGMAAGYIDTTSIAAIAKARADTVKAMMAEQPEMRRSAAMSEGSKEAYSAILQSSDFANRNQQVELLKSQLDKQAAQIGLLRDIKENTKTQVDEVTL